MPDRVLPYCEDPLERLNNSVDCLNLPLEKLGPIPLRLKLLQAFTDIVLLLFDFTKVSLRDELLTLTRSQLPA
jgi:hypothetical protein